MNSIKEHLIPLPPQNTAPVTSQSEHEGLLSMSQQVEEIEMWELRPPLYLSKKLSKR